MPDGEGRVRVLVVDDDQDVADVTARHLEADHDDFEVATEYGGTAGLQRVDDGEFDCVVSDYQMPDMDGLEFLEAVRETDADLPFLLYTGKGSEEIASDAISAGVTDYLRKGVGTEGYEILANRIRNVVSRAQAERAERHLGELARATDRILYIFTHDWGELLFINDAYEDIWGRSVERLRESSRDFLNGIHPEDRDMVVEHMERMSAGESITIEYRVNEGEDFGRWVRVRGEPIRDGAGDVVRVAGFATDITAEKHREQEIQRTKNKMEAAVEAGAVGTWEWDVRSGTVTTGPEFARTFDIDPEAASEGVDVQAFLDAVHDEDRERVEATLRAAIEECGEYEAEYRVRDADGDLRWVASRGKVECEDGEAARFPGAVIDITDRKEYERRLERQNDRLDEFASVVSHDLRNPLNVATGTLELIRTERDSDNHRTVARALDRMDGLIDDMLTLARQGKTVSDPDPVSLAAVAEGAWHSLREEDASLDVTVDGVRVMADEGRLQAVFENLFANAVQHGGSDVSILVEPTPSGFAVEDNGPGIPPADRSDVFESGYTTHESGTGFGLAIVRSIVEAHGWEIAIEESPPGGARFEVSGVEHLED